MIEKLPLFRLQHLADLALKMNKKPGHFQENNSQYLLPMMKFKLSRGNWEFTKPLPTSVSVTVSGFSWIFLPTVGRSPVISVSMFFFNDVWCYKIPYSGCVTAQWTSRCMERSLLYFWISCYNECLKISACI